MSNTCSWFKGYPKQKHKRIPCGKPLIQWTIEKAFASSLADEVLVSTDDKKIAHVAESCGASVPFLRPLLLRDTSSAISVILHAIDHLPDFTDLLLLQPTSPLRSVEDIQNIFKLYSSFDSEPCVSVVRSYNHPALMFNLTNNQKLVPLQSFQVPSTRQELEPTYALNGAIYLASYQHLKTAHSFLSSSTHAYEMPPERSIDIDTPYDWDLAEFLMGRTIS